MFHCQNNSKLCAFLVLYWDVVIPSCAAGICDIDESSNAFDSLSAARQWCASSHATDSAKHYLLVVHILEAGVPIFTTAREAEAVSHCLCFVQVGYWKDLLEMLKRMFFSPQASLEKAKSRKRGRDVSQSCYLLPCTLLATSVSVQLHCS